MKKEKDLCENCKIEKKCGFLSTNDSFIFWNDGDPGFFKSLFSKVHKIKCYSCPKCGKIDFVREINKKVNQD